MTIITYKKRIDSNNKILLMGRRGHRFTLWHRGRNSAYCNRNCWLRLLPLAIQLPSWGSTMFHFTVRFFVHFICIGLTIFYFIFDLYIPASSSIATHYLTTENDKLGKPSETIVKGPKRISSPQSNNKYVIEIWIKHKSKSVLIL